MSKPALHIHTWPHEILSTPCKEVVFDDDADYVLDEMWRHLRRTHAIGLAANQVGMPLRIIIIKVDTAIEEIINPKIVWQHRSKPVVGPEGCLSFPGKRVMVPRNRHVKVSGFDREMNPITIGGKDLRARVLQHEIDHLDGVTMLDRVNAHREAQTFANIGKDMAL